MNNKIVIFETNFGDIKIKLFNEKSPITANNFQKLVESGFYDGLRVHRIVKDFVIQAGDPLSRREDLRKRWGTGGSEVIQDEFIKGLSNKRGTLSMANSGPNSGSSQFFINLVNNDFLDWDKKPLSSKHPVFGEVIEGMEIVDKISKSRVDRFEIPIEDVIIKKAYLQ